MMTLKSIVNEIFNDNTNYHTAQQALNQARSLKSLSNDLYTDPLRFVYELIQNCDDSCHSKSILRIAIVDHRYLIICHNGKAFDENDVRGLCDIGCSTKGQDEQKTGYKGLGFKAVFGKSDCVWILSKGEYFRFEAHSKAFQWKANWGASKTAWEETHQRKFEFPWQICPIWTDKYEVPPVIQQWFLGQLDAVATIVYLKNMNETRTAIEQLIQYPHVFMFLRNIRTVRFSFNSPNETILNVSVLRDQSIKIIYDMKCISHWLLYSTNINVPVDARHDSRLPDKLQISTKTEIMLAAMIDKNDNIGSVEGQNRALFTYLPTKITTYNLPILVNAQFLVNASREHIHTDSSWNQFLFSRIPHEITRWIGQLTQQDKWNEKALNLLPQPLNINDELAQCFNENCPRAVVDVPFLLNFQRTPLKLSEAVIDMTGFSRPDCIGNDLIRQFILLTYSPKPSIALYPFVPNSSRVRRFKILVFDWNQCLDMLKSHEFLTNFSSEQDIRFIIYLFHEYQRQPQIETRLKQLPFLMDNNNILQLVGQIYLPSQFNSADWAATNDTDPYVHVDIMRWLQHNVQVLNWLRLLGLTEKTDEMFVQGKILPNVRHYINQNNALLTIKKLFTSFQHGYIRIDLLQQLNQLKLISQKDNLVPANELYFSDLYFPTRSLGDFQLDQSSFLSPIYLTELEGPFERKKLFFQQLGVQDDIKLIRFNIDAHSELVAAYRYKQTENLFRYNQLQFQRCLTLPFLDVTQQNYQFSIHFWQHIFHSVNIKQLNESEILNCDHQQIVIDNLPTWFVRTRNCIPTTTQELLKSKDVFSSDLRILVGDLLPAFACNVPSPLPYDWQRFFQFKTLLSIEDHLKLLSLIYDRSRQTPLNDENETSIQRIYLSLINSLSRLEKRQFDQYRPKAPFYLLSTINNDFLPTTDLVMSSSKDLTLPNQIPQLKLSTGNLTHNRLLHFLEFFHIRLIGIKDLTVPATLNAQLSLSLRTRLRDLQSYLFELVNTQNITNHCIDTDLEVFEVDRLELYYNETIPVLEKSLHTIDNRIYVTRPWNSNVVMSKLPQILCTQFKLPNNIESDIREFLLDDEMTSAIHSLSLDSSEDFLSLKGTRSQFATAIDRDNEQLFKHLNITDTTTPGEVLLKGLEAQNSPYSDFVYHYTHLENAVSILRDSAIKCRNNLTSKKFKDSAARHIIETTRDEVKKYARFYFRPLTPTQYCNEYLGLPNLSNRYGNQPMCPVPIFFRINLEAILSNPNIQWKISLGNMANPQTDFDSSMNMIKKFDFQSVYADLRMERGKYSSQQEFLIKSQLNLNDFNKKDITLIFQDENALDSLESMIELPYVSLIDSSLYFNLNSRITIELTDIENEVVVSLIDAKPSKNYGQIILQMSGNDINRTIEGNLTKSFQRGTTSTVYADQNLRFIADLNTIKYTIFYEYENQKWIIHTNSSEPHFISPSER